VPNAGDVVVADFPGVMGVKRRPAVVLSSDAYHSARPDVIIGLITSQTASAIGPTDCALLDWSAAGLRLPSAFRAFLVTLPRPSVSAKIGRLSDRDFDAVKQRLRTALVDIQSPPAVSP
jgi:mRNA interferase MazF